MKDVITHTPFWESSQSDFAERLLKILNVCVIYENFYFIVLFMSSYLYRISLWDFFISFRRCLCSKRSPHENTDNSRSNALERKIKTNVRLFSSYKCTMNLTMTHCLSNSCHTWRTSYTSSTLVSKNTLVYIVHHHTLKSEQIWEMWPKASLIVTLELWGATP